MYIRRLYLILLFFLSAIALWSQSQRSITITGDVKDGFLKTPLVDAKVSICNTDSCVLADTCKMTIIYQNSKPIHAVYSAKVMTESKELLVHAWLNGYDDIWQHVSIGKQSEINVPTLEMRSIRKLHHANV